MEMLENESNVVVLNAQPEFTANAKDQTLADYFILCEESDFGGLDMQSQMVAGVSCVGWISRACEKKPMILSCTKGDNVIELIRPYLSDAEYSVVLYSNTPLITKNHIKDLLGYVSIKHMNVCKLTRGFVFKNSYIQNVDEFFSVDSYAFSSDDLFEVSNGKSLSFAENVLNSRILNFHQKSGVQIGSFSGIKVDANVMIGTGTKVADGAKILQGSIVGQDVKIGENVFIKNSKIGDGAIIENNAIIENSTICAGASVACNASVTGSIIAERTKVGYATKISDSKIKNDSVIGKCNIISNARIAENVLTGTDVSLVGCSVPVLIMAHAEIKCSAKVVDKVISSGEIVSVGKIVVGEKL